MSEPVVIPPERLDTDTLRAVIESYITREGTDYGEQEFSLAQKVEQVLQQLRQRRVEIVFDPDSESVTLRPREIPPRQPS